MKVIGMGGDQWSSTYIVTLGHAELEMFLNLYYDKLPKLKVGDEVDLGRGYKFASEIKDAMTKTRDFVQANQKVVTAIMQGLSIEALVRQAEPVATPPSERG